MSTKSYTQTRFSANDAALVMIDHLVSERLSELERELGGRLAQRTTPARCR